jgi:hypothetical protein
MMPPYQAPALSRHPLTHSLLLLLLLPLRCLLLLLLPVVVMWPILLSPLLIL